MSDHETKKDISETSESNKPRYEGWANIKNYFASRFENFYSNQHLEHDANRLFWIFFIAAHLLVLIITFEAFQQLAFEWFGWKLSKNWVDTRDLLIDAHRAILVVYITVNE